MNGPVFVYTPSDILALAFVAVAFVWFACWVAWVVVVEKVINPIRRRHGKRELPT